MRNVIKKIIALVLALALALSLGACGKGLSVDKNGYVSWDAIPNAVEYECAMVDRAYSNNGYFYLTEPGYQLEEGYRLDMRPVFADGSTGDWRTSDFYGESKYDELIAEDGEYNPVDYVDPDYAVRWDQLSCFDVISAIRWDTVRTEDDGLLHFEADGPHGEMRFEAQGVTVENNTLVIQPGGTLWGLDAIGRICAVKPVMDAPGDAANWVRLSGGYTFSEETAVEKHEDLMYVWGQGVEAAMTMDEHYSPTGMMDWQPNFVIFGSDSNSVDAFCISGLEIYYDTTAFTSGIRYMELRSNFYGLYLMGDRYDPSREVYNLSENILTFYLTAVPDLLDELVYYEAGTDSDNISRSIMAFTPEQFETGALRTADGTEVDRSAPLEMGMTIDVTVGDYTYPVALPINEQFRGAQSINELVPFGYAPSVGELNAILVPVAWQDQPEAANGENLAVLKGEVGRVIENGTVTDYSDQITGGPRFSLSEYFDTASYGNLSISTFVTDWFVAPFNFSEYKTVDIADDAFREAAHTWLMESYPDMDWSVYDRDGNGFFDALMFVNMGTSDDGEFYPMTFAGGAHFLPSYNGSEAGTPERPNINGYINVNMSLLGGNVLHHEFGHTLGLIDYYDVTYTGIDAVGRYDMQSSNAGDWNPYSKYAVNWIDPVIAAPAPGESAEYTIGAFCDTGDAIVIPVHGETFDGPFNEYILVDLFTDGGVNAYDAQNYGLAGACGVRMYHVDARMETHIEEENGVTYPLGTPSKVNAYNPGGTYHVELIQAGQDNTFTDLDNLRANALPEDLFYAGMTFDMESYSDFFLNGTMDDGSQFPYTIEVVSISGSEAVIRVTANP